MRERDGGREYGERDGGVTCVCVYEREINFCLSSHHYLGTFLSLIHTCFPKKLVSKAEK